MNAPFALEVQKSPRSRVRRGGWSWGLVEGAKLRVLSLGAGVQSTTLALMAAHGEIGPRPDAVIFSDPGDERRATMAHLDWLEAEITKRTNGQMRCLRTGRDDRLSDRIRMRSSGCNTRIANDRFVSAPFFTLGRGGKVGQGKRQCTREYKVEPLEKLQRELLGYLPRRRIPSASCEVWIGISTDEVVRAGAAYSPWIVHRYPLLELRMSRHDCAAWLTTRGYPVPVKSACIFCPYKTDAEWRDLRDNDPEAWADAVEIDRLVRNTPAMRQQEFLHRSCRPLAESISQRPKIMARACSWSAMRGVGCERANPQGPHRRACAEAPATFRRPALAEARAVPHAPLGYASADDPRSARAWYRVSDRVRLGAGVRSRAYERGAWRIRSSGARH